MRTILKKVSDSIYLINNEQFRFVFVNHTEFISKDLVTNLSLWNNCLFDQPTFCVTTTCSTFTYAVLSLVLREKAP